MPATPLTWRVKINEAHAYDVMAGWAAEAEYEAVRVFRRDESVDPVVRKAFIATITTRCLSQTAVPVWRR